MHRNDLTSLYGTHVIGIAVVFFCYSTHGHFLMALRSPHTRDEHGRWDIGGGALEHGLTPEEQLNKEIAEEYGTTVQESTFLGYRNVFRTMTNGAATHWLALDFAVRIDPNTVCNGEPHKFDAVQWFTLDTLPQHIHSQLPNFLSRYHSRLTSLLTSTS